MFTLYSLLLLAVSLMVAATAIPHHAITADKRDGGGAEVAGQCNTGSMSCCNSVQSADSSTIAYLLGALGVVTVPIQGLIGVSCTPITGLGLGGNSCNAQPVCCSNNSFNGFINIGCTPINIVA